MKFWYLFCIPGFHLNPFPFCSHTFSSINNFQTVGHYHIVKDTARYQKW